MSTATIYADRRGEPHDPGHDETTGVIGGEEQDVPLYWECSVRIARRWEQADADTPHTRRVALRRAMVMEPARGGVFDVLLALARLGLGGPVAGGGQHVSWIHDQDFARAVSFLLERDDLSGPVNLSAPEPLPQRELARELRRVAGPRGRWAVTRCWPRCATSWPRLADSPLQPRAPSGVPGQDPVGTGVDRARARPSAQARRAGLTEGPCREGCTRLVRRTANEPRARSTTTEVPV